MGSSADPLGSLQRAVLAAFFARTQRFFLTGGAALAGFYLRHRTTRDLDLFAAPDVQMSEGVDALVAACTDIGATATILQQHGDFRRYVVSRDTEQTLVDLVIDRAPRLPLDKVSFGAIRVDPLREIASNKLCTLLDRVEPRDLVDLEMLLAGSLRLEDVLRDAQTKHAGADPATLAWVLGTWNIPPTAALPEHTTVAAIETFREELVRQLTRLALPTK